MTVGGGVKTMSAGLLTGLAFGTALEKGKVAVPYIIAQQMGMDNMTMLRMFLGAAATSMVAMAGMQTLGVAKRDPKPPRSLGLGDAFGANIVGGALQGAAMTLGGACPGTVWSQVGAGIANAPYVVLGGLVGTLLYGYADKIFKGRTGGKYTAKAEAQTLDKALNVPYQATAATVAAAFVGVIVAVNRWRPWRGQLSAALADPSTMLPAANGALPDLSLSAGAWDPLVSGMVVGLLQIPAMLTSQGLGASSGWVELGKWMSCACDCNSKDNAPVLHSEGRKWQVGSAVGIVAGSALSVALSGVRLSAKAAAPVGRPLRSFVGGVALLFGARMSGGCPSGHGITGMATLSLASMVTVASMFAGGMATAFLEKAIKRRG